MAMRRRQFLGVLGGTVAWPLAASAQQPAMPVIGFLNGQSPINFAHLLAAFREGLSEAGYIVDRNVAIEYRWAEGLLARAPMLAADLVRQKVAVIAATGGSHTAAKSATSTIPIVCSIGGDPVKEGLVASLNKPGGNVTGAMVFSANLEAKRLELMHELVPQATLVGLIVDSTFRSAEDQVQEVESAARALALRVLIVRIANEADIEPAFTKLHDAKASAVSIAAGPFTYSRRAQFIAQAARHAIPAIYENRETATAGGLMSYGTSVPGVYRKIGVYTGRVLKGERPAELPILQPTNFDMVVNLKAAKALGIEMPTSLLLRADTVIE
jgi:putative ABC transport system substrate-binding protein